VGGAAAVCASQAAANVGCTPESVTQRRDADPLGVTALSGATSTTPAGDQDPALERDERTRKRLQPTLDQGTMPGWSSSWDAVAVTEPATGALPGKWTALSTRESSEMATRLLSERGAVLTAQTHDSVSGYVPTLERPDHWRTALLVAPMQREHQFTLTFDADSGGTRMHGSGEGRGLDAVVWVADQLVAAEPDKAIVSLTRELSLSFALLPFRVFIDDVQLAVVFPDEPAVVAVEPGPHLIKVKARLAFAGKAAVKVTAGEVICLRCGPQGQRIRVWSSERG